MTEIKEQSPLYTLMYFTTMFGAYFFSFSMFADFFMGALIGGVLSIRSSCNKLINILVSVCIIILILISLYVICQIKSEYWSSYKETLDVNLPVLVIGIFVGALLCGIRKTKSLSQKTTQRMDLLGFVVAAALLVSSVGALCVNFGYSYLSSPLIALSRAVVDYDGHRELIPKTGFGYLKTITDYSMLDIKEENGNISAKLIYREPAGFDFADESTLLTTESKKSIAKNLKERKLQFVYSIKSITLRPSYLGWKLDIGTSPERILSTAKAFEYNKDSFVLAKAKTTPGYTENFLITLSTSAFGFLCMVSLYLIAFAMMVRAADSNSYMNGFALLVLTQTIMWFPLIYLYSGSGLEGL